MLAATKGILFHCASLHQEGSLFLTQKCKGACQQMFKINRHRLQLFGESLKDHQVK